ncbi:hypothetical protein DY000_02036591 [Brassica cretica]|uniref:Uncharacterized protein n=1 Tax=Brassica cretica TaxID=69181 RepID=A0ABQ7BN93_BRACR|nr:hypothetical protein DY000_02036591 [Brassica cretica]
MSDSDYSYSTGSYAYLVPQSYFDQRDVTERKELHFSPSIRFFLNSLTPQLLLEHLAEQFTSASALLVTLDNMSPKDDEDQPVGQLKANAIYISKYLRNDPILKFIGDNFPLNLDTSSAKASE